MSSSEEEDLWLNDCDEHRTEMRATLAQMWDAGELCDLTLLVGTRRFLVHRVVLAAASRYFRSLFASGMRDAKLDEVSLEDVDESTFAKALTFVYLGSVSVRPSEMTAFLQVASRFELSALLRRCVDLFTNQLAPETAIDTYTIADTLGIPELLANAKAMTCRRFSAVAAHHTFRNIPCELLRELIASDSLRAKEPQVLDAVLRWVRADEAERAKELETLLPLVRFPLMPVSFISDVVYAEPLVTAQPCWEKLALEAYRFQTTAEKRVGYLASERTAVRSGSCEVFAVGGQCGLRGEMSQGRVEGSVSRYCSERGTWESVPSMRTARSKVGVAVLEGAVYSLGGSGPSGAVCSTVERLCPLRDSWEAMAPLSTPRSGVGVGVLDGVIYAVGGTDGVESALASGEKFSLATGCWEPIAPMSIARLYASVGVLDGCVYAVGGWEGLVDRAVASVERYSPASNSWESVAAMSVARSAAGIEVLGGQLYAVGGGDGASRWRTVERYCPRRNVWESVPSMSRARSNLGVAVLDQQLYVCGGWDGSEDFASAERFCPRKGTWEAVHSLPEGRRGLRCCVAPSVH